MTQHQVFELAHYFKEDTALFLGLSLVVVTLHVQHRRPGWDAALLLGAACGLCLSAKYLGAVMIIPAAVIMGAAQRGKRVSATQWGWFAAGLIAAAAVVNFPVFGHLDVFRHSFGRETELVAQGGRENMGGQVAIFEYIRIFVGDTNPVVWVLVGAEMIAIRRRGDVFDWTMGIFPFAFMLLLCCSTKTNDRYFLPATAGFHYLAALGALDLPGMLPVKWRTRLTPWKLAGVALLVNVGLLVPYLVAFAHDDRREMLDWIGANVPASAVIAGEERANLPVTTRPERLGERPLLAQRAMETPFAADLGDTPQALAGKGIRYVVVSESNYGIFFRKATTGRLTPEMQRKRAFYVALFKDYQPVWERERGTVIYLHPGLRVYRLGAG